MSNATDVLVVGGGIAGLATAVGLTKTGASVTVVEQEQEFEEVGAGLELAPNGTRVLAEWGLLDELAAMGVAPRALAIKDAITGEELTRQDLGAEFVGRYGSPYLVAHRSDLLDVLLRAAKRAGVTLITSERIVVVESLDHTAVARAESGNTYQAQLVLAADGLNSTLRKALSDDAPIPSGYVAYRGTSRMSDVDLDVDLRDVVVHVGPGCHFVQYSIRQDTDHQGQLLNQVAVFQSPAYLRGESPWGEAHELPDAFSRCTDSVRRGLEYIPTERNWLMYDREPIDNWVDGRLVLIGDAAHPMLQYLAQGACQSLEDAWVMQKAATRHGSDWQGIARAFNGQRAPRTARVQRTARMWGESWHLDGVSRTIRNMLFSERDVHDFRFTDWLYSESALGAS